MNESANVTQAAALTLGLPDAEQVAAPATIRAYRTALRALDEWLAGRPLTDGTLAGYLRHRRDTDRVSYATSGSDPGRRPFQREAEQAFSRRTDRKPPFY